MTDTTTAHLVGAPKQAPSVPTTSAVDASLEPALTEAIAQASAGDWAAAERTVHACLGTLPPKALPHAYIACVALVPRLAAANPAGDRIDSAVPVATGTGRPTSPAVPRPLAVRDPALDYAHAVLNALRSRLANLAGPDRPAR